MARALGALAQHTLGGVRAMVRQRRRNERLMLEPCSTATGGGVGVGFGDDSGSL